MLLTAAAKIKEKKPIKTGTSSGHITNLKQSILETFDIYEAGAENSNRGQSSANRAKPWPTFQL